MRQKKIEVPLYMIAIQDDGFHVFLDARVNGHKLFMLLDTGASRTVFDIQTLKDIHAGIEFEENEDKATGLGTNSVDNYITVIDNFELNGLKMEKYETGVVDLSHVNSSYSKINIHPIAGVLGSDLLMRYKAVIDYKKKLLKLTPEDK